MAVVEVVDSVFGNASLGVKLSKTLFQVGHRTVSAGHQINIVATNVTLFSSMLKEVGNTLQDPCSLHSSEATEIVKQIVNESHALFKEITALVLQATNDKQESNNEPVVANARKRRPSTLIRAKEYFEQAKVEHMLQQLEYLKTTLAVLIQVLNLAALMATLKGMEKSARVGQQKKSDEITSARLHVETLIVAQHLSVVVLDRIQNEQSSGLNARASTPFENGTSYDHVLPNVLSKAPSPSTSMVRLSDSNNEFLERRGSAEGDEMAPTQSKADVFIDKLLTRWTCPPEQSLHELSQDTGQAMDLESQHQWDDSDSPASPDPQADSSHETLPGVKLHPVESPEQIRSVADGGLTPQLLDPNVSRGRTPQSPCPTQSQMVTPPTQSSSTPRPNSSLQRTVSNPEADGQTHLDSFQGHHSLDVPDRAATPRAGSPAPPRSPTSPVPMPYNISSLVSFTRSPAPSSVGSGMTSPHPTNYRPPYAESWCSTPPSSDSDTEVSFSPEPRQKFGHPRKGSAVSRSTHDSGIGGTGLNIPWRIRISQNKYYDFLDDQIVGPRTPYKPADPSPWIYMHDQAFTEISKRWVCKEALEEKRLQVREIREEQDFAMGMSLDDGGLWKILQPLKFSDVEALVERTIDIYEEKTRTPTVDSNNRSSSPRQPSYTQRSIRPSIRQIPRANTQGPYQTGQYHPSRMPAIRPHSTTDVNPGHAQYRSGTNSGDRSPRDSQDFAAGTPSAQQNLYYPGTPMASPHSYFPPTPWPPPIQGPTPHNTRKQWSQPSYDNHPPHGPQHYPRDRESRQHSRRERERREYERSRERDLDHGGYGYRDGRPGSKSGPSEKKEKDKKKKTSGKTMAGTLASIGGLAALLEGLDGAF